MNKLTNQSNSTQDTEVRSRELLDEAKRQLRGQLIDHPDAGVRTLAHIAELADNHPAVQRIAAALKAKAQQQ